MIKVNGGFMKFSKQTNKWILSTALVMALGSQYYYSVSSNSFGSVEMSSTALLELNAKIKDIDSNNMFLDAAQKAELKKSLYTEYTPKILAEEREAERVKKALAQQQTQPQVKVAADKTSPSLLELQAKLKEVDSNKSYDPTQKAERSKALIADYSAKILAEQKAKTEAVVTSTGCTSGDCDKKFTATEVEDIIKALLKKEATIAKDDAAAKEALAKAEALKNETPAERRIRLREEREDARAEAKRKKDEIAEAKAEKIRVAKEIRNDEFTDKAEEMAEKCGEDLNCKVSGMASLLNRYTGRNRQIDMITVSKAYNLYIDKDLKAGLRGDDGDEGKANALQAIKSLASEIPSAYKGLKTRTIDAVKTAEQDHAKAVNTQFRMAEQFAKLNKPTESLAARQQGFAEEAVFRADAYMYSRGLQDSLQSVRDTTTLEYFKTNYIPEMNRLLANLYNTTGVTGNSTVASDVLTSPTTGRAGRNSRTNTVQTTSSGSLNGVNFGTPTTNRVINRTGTAIKN
jgi:hypothetical protein